MIRRTANRSALAFIATLLLSATAQAQLFRAYLAPDGSDANPCTLQQPCRLLPAALTTVADGGEIWMLDSANYNSSPVNITKSVTILAVPGALGSVVATGGNAINIATAGVKVALRNLVIVPLPGGGGVSGVNMTAGAGLTVENCLIANLPQNGVGVHTAAIVRVTDSTLRGNNNAMNLGGGARAAVTRATMTGNSTYGVLVSGSIAGTTTAADIIDSTIEGGMFGVQGWSTDATGVVKVSVRGSLIAGNSTGMWAESFAGASVTFSASNNIVSNNGAGMVAQTAGTKMWAAGNTVSDNTTGLIQGGAGVFESAGNNALRNNVNNKNGTITVVAME